MDYGRAGRIGLEEAVLCGHKSPNQIAAIARDAMAHGRRLLLTRLEQDRFHALPDDLCAALDYDPASRTAFLGAAPRLGRKCIGVIAAGTSDLPVCKEAVRTLHYYGQDCVEIYDVGVAGIWRLLERVPDFASLPVVIVVAGMDAALPTALGGLVPGSVIAVPTSTGYGVANGGQTALNSALCSCSPGIVVVNIDNGYGAACAALRILNAFGECGPSAEREHDAAGTARIFLNR